MTISLYFADGVLDEVRRIRFSDFRITIQKKAEVIMLHGHGLAAEQIAEIMNMSVSTIWNYLREFEKTGLDGLWNPPESPRKSGLIPHRDAIEEEFKKNPPATVALAAKRIEEITGVRRGQTQVRLFLKEMGMEFRKTAVIPAKVDIEGQEVFKKKF